MRRRKRRKRKSRKPVYSLIAVAMVFLCSVTYSFLHPANRTNIKDFSYRAAMVDHLSLSAPNQTFTQTATNILEKAGFTVDYYPGEEVTVSFFKNLPKHDYGLIVLRVHSALMGGSFPPVGLFTSEPVSKTKYVYEQLTNQLVEAKFTDEETTYFGITPLFVKHSMNGRFENAIIIMMGCNGLTYTSMAEAFIEKGAKVYISWSGSVLASATDKATIHLLRHLAIEKQTIEKAVIETNNEVGPDPQYGGILRYYPDSVHSYTIPNSASNLTMNAVQMNTAFYTNKKEKW